MKRGKRIARDEHVHARRPGHRDNSTVVELVFLQRVALHAEILVHRKKPWSGRPGHGESSIPSHATWCAGFGSSSWIVCCFGWSPLKLNRIMSSSIRA